MSSSVAGLEAEFRGRLEWVCSADTPASATVWEAFLDVVRRPVGTLADHLVDGDVLGFCSSPGVTSANARRSQLPLVRLDRRLGLIKPTLDYEGTFVLGIYLQFDPEVEFARAMFSSGEPGGIPAPQPDVEGFRSRVESSAAFASFSSGRLVRVQLTTGFA